MADHPILRQIVLDAVDARACTASTGIPTVADLWRQHARALDLGARHLLDRSDDEHEPLHVYADPEGHQFCIFVAPGGPDDGH